MSASVGIKGFSGKNSPEFQKHLSAVKFCIENELSYPKETSEFFKGKIEGGNLEDYDSKYVLDYIKDGLEVELPLIKDRAIGETRLKVSDIPSHVEEIVIKLYY